MKYLRACLDPRILAGLGMAGVAVWVLAPALVTAAIPLLVVAACPLSMLVMMRSMSGHSATPRPTAGDRELDVRRELADLTERQRQLESQLAARRDRREILDAEPLQATRGRNR